MEIITQQLKCKKMKKLISIMAIIASMAALLSAQDDNTDLRKKFQFGLKAGANYSNIYDTEAQEFSADYKFGFVGGAFLAIPLGKFLGFQPEILYSQKGYKSTGTFLTVPYEFVHTTDYIDVPLLLAIKPSPFVTLLAGPQYSFLIKQKDEFTSGGFTEEQEQEFRNDKSVLGFIGGIDFTLNPFVIGARAGWDLQNNNGDGTTTNPRYKNFFYQATLGIKF